MANCNELNESRIAKPDLVEKLKKRRIRMDFLNVRKEKNK